MRILVLGSAAGGGFPQWNCSCGNCRRVRSGDPFLRARTQSSLAVSADGTRWILLNASPDLPKQIGDNKALHPVHQPDHNKRHSPIAGVVLTNGDVDHVVGLLSLRENQPLTLHASVRVQTILAENRIFSVLNAELVERHELPLATPIALAAADGRAIGLQVEAYSVPGKPPLYMEDATTGAGLGNRPGDTIGLHVTEPATGASFHYVPGCAKLSPELAARLRGAALVFFDGTLWKDDEMIADGLGTKTGQRMGHMSLAGAEGSIAQLAPLGIRRKIFIHINNTNPVLAENSPERHIAESGGWEIAYDGLEIVL